MAIPTVTLSETTPDGNDSVNGGDNRIREYKTQNREILEVDHDYPSSGNSSTAGQHKKVTLQEAADIGSGASGVPIFGAQTDAAGSGKPEACFTDEDDNDVFITDNGRLGNRNIPIIVSTLDAVGGFYLNGVNLLQNIIFPIGSKYESFTDSRNPNTILGFGTWVAIEGLVVAGYKSGDANFGTVGAEVGAATHELTEAEMAAHSHTIVTGTENNTGSRAHVVATSNSNIGNANTSSVGSGTPFSIVQPTTVAYVWKRTA